MIEWTGRNTDREMLAVYVLLAKAFVGTAPYDAKGAFVLLHSITAGRGDATPGFVDSASHLHMVAALGGNEAVKRDARRAMVRVISALERELTFGGIG